MSRSSPGLTRPTLGQLLVAAILALVGVGLDNLAVVRALDRNLTYTALATFLFPRNVMDAPFLIVTVDGRTVDRHGCPPYAPALLTEIERQLQRIGIREMLLPAGEDQWLSALTRLQSGQVSYLVPTVAGFDSYAQQTTLDAPAPSPRVRPIPACASIALADDGFALSFASPVLGTERLPPLPWWIANRVRAGVRSPGYGEFIRFGGPAGTIPALPLSRILAGDFSARDTSGRLVALGVSTGLCAIQLPVPTDPDGMSAAEIQLHAALTLFAPSLETMALIGRIALIGFVALLALFGIGRSGIGRRALWLIVLGASGLALSVGSALLLNLMIPVIAPLAVIAAAYAYVSVTYALVLVGRLRENNQALASQVERWSEQEQSAGESLTKTSFEYLLTYLKDFLPITGAFLFVLPKDAYHFRVVLSANYSEEMIRERRRDIRRMPWLGAISSSSGASLRSFLQDEELLAYGVPMFDFGAVIGMVVLVLPAGTELPDRTRKFLGLLGGYMGRAVLHAHVALGKQRRLRSWLRALLIKDALRSELEETASIAGLVRRQLERYRLILDRTRLAIMVSDLLGSIYYMNTPAKEFVTGARIEFTKRLSDLLVTLAPRSRAMAAELIESAVLGESPSPFEWTDPRTERVYEVCLIGISIAEEGGEIDGRAPISALLVTVNEVTLHRQMDKLRSRMLSLTSSRGKRILDTARSTIAPPPFLDLTLPPPQLALDETWNTLGELFDQFTRLSRRIEQPREGIAETPYDPVVAIREAARELEEEAHRREITIRVEAPESPALVYGDWARFNEGLVALLTDSVHTCFTGNTLTVRVTEETQAVRVAIIDPSGVVSTNLLAAISEQQWEDIPSTLAVAIQSFSRGKIPFWIESEERHGTIFHIELGKL